MFVTGSHPLHELPDALRCAIESSKVPALPQSLLRLLVMTNNDASTMSELAAVVEQDPGLCARILTAANSPGLRRGTELCSVAHCLTSLGTRLIRTIATCLSLQSLFERHGEMTRTDLTDYWRHSIRVAETAREIAIACNYSRPDEAYLAGLLHDIGELILLSVHDSAYPQILAAASDESALATIEVERMGVHHGEVGAWLADQWKFDFSIGDGILFHHASDGEIVTADELPQIVWLAHALSITSVAATDPQLVALVNTMFGQTLADQLAPVAERAYNRTEQIALAIGVVASTAGGPSAIACLPRVSVSAPRPPASAAEAQIDAILHDMALMQPLQRDLFGINSDTELLHSLRESSRILFQLSHIAIFLRNPDDNRLSAARFGEQPSLFRRASIRPDALRCLVSSAANSGIAVSSFDPDYPQPPALIDLQFARVFGTEGLLCVPMNGRLGAIGVMVFGLSAAQHSRLKQRLPWVHNFGRIAALSLEAWHEAISFRQRAENDASAHFERQARRVIHETGNPLGIIRSYLKVLDGKLPNDAPAREEIGILREEIDRVSAIVRRLSESPAAPSQGPGLAIGQLLGDLLAFYDAALFKTRGIAASLSIGETLEAVACDRDIIKQILVNLWKNASEAMPGGGRIDIAVSAGVTQNGRRHVEIRVSDNGPGIPPEALRKLAAGDHGPASAERGMGLSIVGALTRQIGATITCRSKQGVGTEFSLLLPCVE